MVNSVSYIATLTSDDLVAMINEGTRENFAVSKNLHLVGLELW